MRMLLHNPKPFAYFLQYNKLGLLELYKREPKEISDRINKSIKEADYIGALSSCQKKSYIEEMKKNFSSNNSVMIAHYQGLNVKELDELRSELHEVNLLNAKLLYTNKIFRAKNLQEAQKVKVLEAFDKAETVKEVKLVFETLNSAVKTASTKTISEGVRAKGSASAVTPAPKATKQPIVESDEMVAAVRRNDVHVDYIVFPDEGHGFRNRENEINGYRSIREFLDRYLYHWQY